MAAAPTAPRMRPKIDLSMHPHHHDNSHEHHHDRAHAPHGHNGHADRAPTTDPTLLLVSAWHRLMLAGLVLAPLWLAVAWALND